MTQCARTYIYAHIYLPFLEKATTTPDSSSSERREKRIQRWGAKMRWKPPFLLDPKQTMAAKDIGGDLFVSNALLVCMTAPSIIFCISLSLLFFSQCDHQIHFIHNHTYFFKKILQGYSLVSIECFIGTLKASI